MYIGKNSSLKEIFKTNVATFTMEYEWGRGRLITLLTGYYEMVKDFAFILHIL